MVFRYNVKLALFLCNACKTQKLQAFSAVSTDFELLEDREIKEALAEGEAYADEVGAEKEGS